MTERPAHILQEWSPEAHVAFMERANIKLSVLSISSPGTNLPSNVSPDSGVHTLTRTFNTELSDICKRFPSKFAFFASLPLPDVQAAISEIDYALDILGCVGFAIMSNSNGIYPGDPALDAVWKRLDDRNAVVFIHPTSCYVQTPACHQMLQPLKDLPNPAIEFQFDETRAVINLLISGTVTRYPNIRYIMTHAGCVIPAVLERVQSLTSYYTSFKIGACGTSGGSDGDDDTDAPSSVQARRPASPASSRSSATIEPDTPTFRSQLQSNFFFDLAGMPFPDQFLGLKQLVWSGSMLYGSDYPFTSADLGYELAGRLHYSLESYMGKNNEIKEVYMANAQELLKPSPVVEGDRDERSGGASLLSVKKEVANAGLPRDVRR